MSAQTISTATTQDQKALARGIGLPGRVAVSWATAGGMLTGGFLVAAMTLAGRLSGSGLLMTSAGLFVIGALLGFAHGGVLGVLGRPDHLSLQDALKGVALAAVYAVPAAAVGWIVAGWTAMTVVALYMERTAALVAVGAAWLVGALLVAVAARQGWRALRYAYARWAFPRLGTALTTASFAALLVVFTAERPTLWLIDLRVTEVGAVLLALFATVWVAGPLVSVSLQLATRLELLRLTRRPRLAQVATGMALGLAVGVVMGLVALPFYGAPYGVAAPAAGGALGALAVSLSRALVDEVLLRLAAVTGVAWALLRYAGLKREQAVLGGVAVAALVQVVLYLPGVLAIGFPSTLAAVAFVTVGVLLPAVAFGILYWKRGFSSALTAHAAALIALALLA